MHPDKLVNIKNKLSDLRIWKGAVILKYSGESLTKDRKQNLLGKLLSNPSVLLIQNSYKLKALSYVKPSYFTSAII